MATAHTYLSERKGEGEKGREKGKERRERVSWIQGVTECLCLVPCALCPSVNYVASNLVKERQNKTNSPRVAVAVVCSFHVQVAS